MIDLQRRASAPAGSGFSRRIDSGMTHRMDRMTGMTGAEDARAELVELLRRVAGQDRSALRSLYERTSAKLYGICLRALANESDAQDVLQEVYMTVWTKASRFDSTKASVITWLSVLARNKAIDRLRASRAPANDLNAASDVPDDSLSAFEILEQAQDSTRLGHCIEELDERARLMISAAFLEGASYPELAKREGVPLGTMKSWIRRGLQRLRGCLER